MSGLGGKLPLGLYDARVWSELIGALCPRPQKQHEDGDTDKVQCDCRERALLGQHGGNITPNLIQSFRNAQDERQRQQQPPPARPILVVQSTHEQREHRGYKDELQKHIEPDHRLEWRERKPYEADRHSDKDSCYPVVDNLGPPRATRKIRGPKKRSLQEIGIISDRVAIGHAIPLLLGQYWSGRLMSAMGGNLPLRADFGGALFFGREPA